MAQILSERKPIARKEYYCDASVWVNEFYENGLFSYSDLRKIVKMRQRNWKIQKGEKYLYQANVVWGDFFVFRANLEMHEICLKYDLYPEDV